MKFTDGETVREYITSQANPSRAAANKVIR
jgi:hypothetical protein